MEQTKKKTISTILLLVGALFMIISGSIFVSSNWQYIPESIKKLAIVILTAILYSGAYYVKKNLQLDKASTALLYIAICFTGFTAYSLLGFTEFTFLTKLFFAQIAMLIPSAINLWFRRNPFSLITTLLLLDGINLALVNLTDWNKFYFYICNAGLLMALLAFLNKLIKNHSEKNISAEACMLHSFYLLHLMSIGMFAFIGLFDQKGSIYTAFSVSFIFLSACLLHQTYKNIFSKVYSLITMECFFLCVANACIWNFTDGIGFWNHINLLMGALFVINIILYYVFKHSGYFYVPLAASFLLSFVQEIFILFVHLTNSDQGLFIPYAFIMGTLWLLKEYRERNKMVLSISTINAALLILVDVNAFLAFMFKNYSIYYSLAFYVTILLFMLSMLFRIEINGSAFIQTVATSIALLSIMAHPIVKTTFVTASGNSYNFSSEYLFLTAVAGIVLFSIIWYHKKENLVIPRFTVSTLLLIVMLLHNLSVAMLPNVLFLACTSLFILVISGMKSNKKYTLLSATILVLIVLYLTKAVWLSISWWVYLFFAGAGLVLFAIKREKSENK